MSDTMAGNGKGLSNMEVEEKDLQTATSSETGSRSQRERRPPERYGFPRSEGIISSELQTLLQPGQEAKRPNCCHLHPHPSSPQLKFT